MIIKKMTATFGRLTQSCLELEDGLNVIHAPNEAGKSTWCAFLRAMFYGIPTRERDRKGFLAEKNRYLPWSGAPMEGQIDLVWQGQNITLRRFQRGSTPFGGFSAVYTGTGDPVPGLTAQNCGEHLLGVGREVWERSAFVGQAPTLAIDGTPELERRIAAMFSSGQEDISYSQVDARLREWQRRRQHNKSGLIPRIEAQLAEITSTLGRMEAADLRLAQTQERCTQLEARQKELEADLHIHRRLAQRQLNARYAEALQELEQARAKLDALQAQQARFGTLPHRDLLRDAQGQLQRLSVLEEELLHTQQQSRHAEQAAREAADFPYNPRFAGMDPQQAAAQAHRDRAAAEALLSKAQRSRKLRPLFSLTGLIPAAACALGLLTEHKLLFTGIGFAALLVTSLSAVLLCSHAIKRTQSQAEQLLDSYAVQRPDQISAAAEDFCRRQEQSVRAQEDARRLQADLLRQQERLDGDRADLLSFVGSFAAGVTSLTGCAAALTGALELEDRLRECRERLDLSARRCEDLKAQGAQEADTLELFHAPSASPEQTRQELEQVTAELAAARAQLAMTRGELLTLGDRSGLESAREELSRQLERRRKEYEALDIALDALRQANTQLQARFAPELSHRAGQILSRLTAGRYESLSLDREFEACARSDDSLLPHSVLALSRGTADQIYLAVRLGVCQLVLPQEDPSPLILDDALLTFDDARMVLAVELLSALQRQVLLFSCQQRESKLGRGNILHLQTQQNVI
ncbi:MAG: AAA family ATPase [Oscillospiraceae bacterium]|nr:AAA family ATPase [Oscillospiraceae bacterium]